MPTHYLILPVVAALIGWFTNFLAVRMIFRPHEPVNVLGLKVQGLLPKRRAEFAESIGSTIEEHLISSDDIKLMLEDPEVKARLDLMIRKGVDEFLERKITAISPMVAGFLSGGLAVKLKESLVSQLSGMFGKGVEEIGTHMDENLDLKGIVQKKIENFDMLQLEQIVLRVAKKELRGIEVLGAVLGFIVGLGQLAMLALWPA